MTQEHRDLVSSIFCIAVGILFCIGSVKFGDVRAAFPNAGFFPFMGGVALIFLSLIHLISTMPIQKEEAKKVKKFFPQEDSWKRVLSTVFISFIYGVSLPYLGFLITTFLFMILLLRFVEPQRWRTILITALLTSVSCYTLFEVLLKVELPKGLFGI